MEAFLSLGTMARLLDGGDTSNPFPITNSVKHLFNMLFADFCGQHYGMLTPE